MNPNILRSPIKNTPSCWEDDKRMSALYSPFRMREINPVDYDSKMKFWRNNIYEWCLEKNTCVFSVKKIQDEFKRKERVPLGLMTVVQNLERDSIIKAKEDFLSIDPNETWTGWAVKSLVKATVLWSFSKLKATMVEIDEINVEYIHLEFLKRKSNEVLSKCSGHQKLWNLSEVKDLVKSDDGVEFSQESLDILLKWMQMNKTIQIRQIENDTLIKFKSENDKDISDVEIDIYVIEKNKLVFEKAIETLEEEKDDLILAAKAYLKKGMRDMAKSYLRRKKEVEKTIGKRVIALENIEIMLARIHDSSTDSKVLDTYRIAMNALKKTFKENGLSEDEVTKTITEIQEINEMHEEIQNALADPISNVYETELDEELKEILDSEKKKDELLLPDVPSHSPEKSISQRFLKHAS